LLPVFCYESILGVGGEATLSRKRNLLGSNSVAVRVMVVLLGLTAASYVAVAPARAATAPTVVSLTFDDNRATQTSVGPMLAAHGMDGTFFVNSDSVGTDGHLSWRQLSQLSSDGNEIAGHTLDHVDLTSVDSTQVRWQVCEDRARLLKHGFSVTNFAYPYGYGWTDSTARSTIQQCGYNSARRAWGLVSDPCTWCTAWAETIPPADPYGVLTAENPQSTTTLDTIESYVTGAETHGGGWVILVFHDICDGCSPESTSPSTLQGLLDWLQPRATQGTIVKTMAQVIGGPVQASPGTADTAPPTSSISCNGSACSSSSYAPPVQVTLAAADNGGSGLEAIRYTTDGTNPTLSSPVYGVPLTVSGTTTVKYQAWDNAGNVSAVQSQLITVNGADTTPPTTAIACNSAVCSSGWYSAAVSVSLSATDPDDGVKETHYTLDGSDPTLSSLLYTGAFTVSTTSTVKYRSWDTSGNVEPAKSQAIRIDTTAPVSSISCDGGACSSGWYAVGVQVVLTATDGAGSGVAVIRYTTNGSDPTGASPSYGAPFTVSTTTTVKYRAWDNAGNVGATKSQLIQVDTIAPTAAITSPSTGANVTGTVQVQAAAGDSGSGIAQVMFYLDGIAVSTSSSSPYKFPWNTKKTSKGLHTLTAVAVDKAGNKTTSSAVTVTVN
jgi:peptidoglycan/xylan/chitin deacetylase (PgdA/CDA1 family)